MKGLKQEMLVRNFRQRSLFLFGSWFLCLLLVACGEDGTPKSVAVSPANLQPTASPSPTVALPTIAPTTVAATAVATRENSTLTASALTPQAAEPTPTKRPVAFPTVAPATVTANSNAVQTAQAQTTPLAQPTSSGTSIFGPTITASPSPNSGSTLIFYTAGNVLKSIRSNGSGVTSLADNVVNFVRVGDNAVVYYQETGNPATPAIQLKYRRDNQEIILDNPVFTQIPGESPERFKPYGIDTRVFFNSLAVSPDGRQVAYIKANLNTTFDQSLPQGKERPSELWIANLDLQNPAPRQLVANDKNYIFRPVWSTDGNRIAFGRTDTFGTGAGYAVALWSVYKDGTRLAFLTGPDLGNIGGRPNRASTFRELRWLSPVSITFQTTTFANSLWLHDLTLGSDFPRPLALATSGSAYYCPQIRRYFFAQVDDQANFAPKGLASVPLDKTDPKDFTLPSATVFDPIGKEVFGCQDSTVFYQDGQSQLLMRKFNADGSPSEAGIKLLNVTGERDTEVNISPEGDFFAVRKREPSTNNTTLYLFRRDGTLLDNQTLNGSLTDLRWLGKGVIGLVTIEFSKNTSQLYLGEVSNSGMRLVSAATVGETPAVKIGQGLRIGPL